MLEENGSSVIEALPWSMVRQTEEQNENLSHESQCPDRDANRAPTQYKFRALLRAQFRLLESNK